MRIGLDGNPELEIPGIEELFDIQEALETPIDISAIQGGIPSAGPGIRTEVFFHGCSRGCPGCINEWTVPAASHVTTVEKAVIEILRLGNRNISISGGEPFEQEEALLALVRVLDYMSSVLANRFDMLLYTGYEVPEVIESPILSFVDYLVAGPFIQALAYNKLPDSFVGSSNQHFLMVKPRQPGVCFVLKEIPLDQYGRLATNLQGGSLE